jgi:hypothetical protein
LVDVNPAGGHVLVGFGFATFSMDELETVRTMGTLFVTLEATPTALLGSTPAGRLARMMQNAEVAMSENLSLIVRTT